MAPGLHIPEGTQVPQRQEIPLIAIKMDCMRLSAQLHQGLGGAQTAINSAKAIMKWITSDEDNPTPDEQ